MPRSKKLVAIKFHSINRDIKAAKIAKKYSSSVIAKKHHVSRDTVQAVARAKTWPAFVTAKQLKAATNLRRREAVYANSQEQAPLQATKKILSDALPSKATTKAFASELKQLELNPVKYVTYEEFYAATEALESKLHQESLRGEIHRGELDQDRRDINMLSALVNKIQQRKPGWFRAR